MSEHAPPPADPKALRALAHPLRWKLLDLIGSEDSATATRCAEVLGESVASCSYHLGILGKYGYIEPVSDQAGREKPWRLASWRQMFDPQGLDVDGKLAAEAAAEAFLDHELARIKARMRSGSLEPTVWQPRFEGMTTWLTEAEFTALKEQLRSVLEPFGSRSEDPGLRPAGSREARLFYAASVAHRRG
jgi:hypothetical protein